MMMAKIFMIGMQFGNAKFERDMSFFYLVYVTPFDTLLCFTCLCDNLHYSAVLPGKLEFLVSA